MKDRLVAQAVAQMPNRLCSFLWSHFARVISILCRRRYFVSVFYGILQRTLCPPLPIYSSYISICIAASSQLSVYLVYVGLGTVFSVRYSVPYRGAGQ